MFQGLLLVLGNAVPGLFQPRPGYFQIRRGCGLPAVEAVGEFQQRDIALGADAGDDVVHRVVHGLVRYVVPGQQRIQACLEVCRAGIQLAYVSH